MLFLSSQISCSCSRCTARKTEAKDGKLYGHSQKEQSTKYGPFEGRRGDTPWRYTVADSRLEFQAHFLHYLFHGEVLLDLEQRR